FTITPGEYFITKYSLQHDVKTTGRLKYFVDFKSPEVLTDFLFFLFHNLHYFLFWHLFMGNLLTWHTFLCFIFLMASIKVHLKIGLPRMKIGFHVNFHVLPFVFLTMLMQQVPENSKLNVIEESCFCFFILTSLLLLHDTLLHEFEKRGAKKGYSQLKVPKFPGEGTGNEEMINSFILLITKGSIRSPEMI
ncbi:hypothetical protein ACJX0J_040769, partial [Zea mays]